VREFWTLRPGVGYTSRVYSFVRELITEWRRLDLPFAGETVVVGVSGGADSVSLLLGLSELHRMGKLDLRLVAAHFDHELRDGESRADVDFVRQLTTERKIELAVGHPKERIEGGNIEQRARVARYRFLTDVAGNIGAFAIATGHTVNDQAETFLINLLRGSGPDGLCGMKPVRPIDHEPPPQPDGCEAEEAAGDWLFPVTPLLVRPLLSWAKRADTEGYCHHLGVEYRYDTMNEDTAFKRVRIRKILLPLLKDFNPNIIEVLANTARLMQDLPAAGNHFAERGELSLSELRSLDDARLRDALRHWVGGHRGGTRQIGLKHIEAVIRLIKSEASGRVAEFPGGGRVVKSGGQLRYEENKVEK
jgi:tRNA(Ile)-lysidine synthase